MELKQFELYRVPNSVREIILHTPMICETPGIIKSHTYSLGNYYEYTTFMVLSEKTKYGKDHPAPTEDAYKILRLSDMSIWYVLANYWLDIYVEKITD